MNGTRARFVVEPPLVKLGRWMRAAGDDVASVEAGLPAGVLSARAAREDRVVLTRRRDFPAGPAPALVLTADRLEEQLAQVYGAFGPPDLAAGALTRCLLCNARLEEIDPRAAQPPLPPRVAERRPRVFRCPSCARRYWEGTHTEALRLRLRRVTARGATVPEGALSRGFDPTAENLRLAELRAFLESFGFAWRGYRRKWRTARAGLARRMGELGLDDYRSYAARVRDDPAERRRLHELLGVSVSRFFRDRVDWDLLARRVLAPWREQGGAWRAWSMGCASGEEPYTLRLIWLELPAGGAEATLEIVASEVRPDLLARARRGVYPLAALHSIPQRVAHRWLRREGDAAILDPAVRASVDFVASDYLTEPWPAGVDLILARNGIFTYREPGEHEGWLERIAATLRPGGFLFLGSNDRVPDSISRRFAAETRTIWRLA